MLGAMAQQLPLDELSMLIGRIRGLLLTEEKVVAAVHSLARAAKDSVPGTIGAGVSLLDSRGTRTSSGYTDSIVQQADAVQYQLGEGPCLTAWATERPVLVSDVHGEHRWPEWRRAVQQLPVRSVVTAPLIAGREAIGSLKLYSSGPHTYDGSSGRLLELFAAPAATLIAHIQASEAPQKLTEGLRQSLYSRDVVNRACGVLMERQAVPHEAALRQLIKAARDRGATLQQVSEAVLSGPPAPRA